MFLALFINLMVHLGMYVGESSKDVSNAIEKKCTYHLDAIAQKINF